MPVMAYRDPMDTAQEFEPYEVADGELLDLFGTARHVLRMENELDPSYRGRIREAIRMEHKSKRAEHGESLVPERLAESLGVPVASESMMPTHRMITELAGDGHFAVERVRQLEAEARAHREELLGLRGAIKDIALSARLGDWVGIHRALDRVS